MTILLVAVGPLHPLLQARLSVFIVHFSYFVGFIVACLLSWYPGNHFVMSQYRSLLEDIIKKSPIPKSKSDQENEIDAELRTLDIEFGRKVGKLERVFYIYSFMFNSLGLLSAWVLLKAFFGWIQKQERIEGTSPQASMHLHSENKTKAIFWWIQKGQREHKHNYGNTTRIREISQYHLYLWGNGLSILLSLGLSKLGNIVSESVLVAIKLYKDLLLPAA